MPEHIRIPFELLRGMSMNRNPILLFSCFTLAASAPALAHHSFAMFDNAKTMSLDGTVKALEWINPHSWIHIVTLDSTGKPVEWAFEMGGPGQLTGQGWTRDSVKVGDKITVTFHPMKDGSHGGSEMSVKLPNGTVLGGRGGFFGGRRPAGPGQ
jgi:hypothetical protein